MMLWRLSLPAAPALFLVAGLAAVPLAAVGGFSLQKGPRGYWHLVMPTEVAVALRDSAPGFEAWPDSAYAKSTRKDFPYDEHSAPFAIVRDLNGDGREDLVLDGRRGLDDRSDKGILQVVLIMSREGGYRVMQTVGVGHVRLRPGPGLKVGRRPDSTYVFRWGPTREDDSIFFWWSDSLGFQEFHY